MFNKNTLLIKLHISNIYTPKIIYELDNVDFRGIRLPQAALASKTPSRSTSRFARYIFSGDLDQRISAVKQKFDRCYFNFHLCNTQSKLINWDQGLEQWRQ